MGCIPDLRRSNPFCDPHVRTWRPTSIVYAGCSVPRGVGSLSVCRARARNSLGVRPVSALKAPLKWLVAESPTTKNLGQLGTKAFLASRLVMEVELLKSPHSQSVNPMMDAIALTLLRSKQPVSTEDLLKRAVKRYLMRWPIGERTNWQNNADASFSSALSYLEEGDVILRTEDGRWRLQFGLVP